MDLQFAMKLAGATYMDVHRMGGGIGFTVRHTRESSQEELEQLTEKRFDAMLRHGTTLVEAKTGGGCYLSVSLVCLCSVACVCVFVCLHLCAFMCARLPPC